MNKRFRALALALPLASCASVPPDMRAAREGNTAALLAMKLELGDRCEPCGGPMNRIALLGCAAQFGRVDTVKALLGKGADVDSSCRNWKGPLNSALGRATRTGQVETVRVLLDSCADPEIPTSAEGMEAGFKTPRQIAENAGHAAITELLSRYPGKASCLEARKVRDKRARWASRLDEALREGPPPQVPEAARKFAIRAGFLLKNAPAAVEAGKSAEEAYARVTTEYEQAIDLAPWWADAYFNLALVQEKAGDPRSAMDNLGLYLKAKPGAADAEAVRRRIIELEVEAEARER